MRGLARLARKAFQFSLILAVISRYLTLCLGDSFYARPGNCGPQGIEL